MDGSGIPDVDFDIGPSWAGLLPISGDKNETRQVRVENLEIDQSLRESRPNSYSSGSSLQVPKVQRMI